MRPMGAHTMRAAINFCSRSQQKSQGQDQGQIFQLLFRLQNQVRYITV